jgi:AcrR family transcriptional regulator
MRKVAQRVGVTAPAIYRHFAGKDDLLQHVVAEGFKIFSAYLHEALQGTTPLDRLRLTGEAYARFAADHPRFYKVMFVTPHDFKADDAATAAFERRNMATFQFLLDRIRECMDCGALRRDDPEKVALTIWTMSHGIMSLYFARSRFIPDAATLEKLRLELNLRLFQGLMPGGATIVTPG